MGLVRLRRGVEHCVAGFEVPNVVAPSLESVVQAEEMPNLVHRGVPQVVRIRVPARKRGVQQEHAVIDVPFVDLVRPMRDPAERTAVGLASVHVEVSLRALRERSLDDPLSVPRSAVFAEKRRPRCVIVRANVRVPHRVQTKRHAGVHGVWICRPVVP